MDWANTQELLESIRSATDRLVGGEASVEEAHAEARLLGVASKILAIRLDHARLTGRLTQGDPSLPDVRLTQD